MLKIIPKSTWGGRFSRGPLQPRHPCKLIFHHLGPVEGDAKFPHILYFEGFKSIRKIQNEDMDTFGLADIRYHYVIAPNGDIYEGRPPHVIGQHTKKNNRDSIGILVVGNFNVEKPTEAQVLNIKELVIYLSMLFPSLVIPECIYGHRDFAYEDCPGDSLYEILFDLKHGRVSLFTEPDFL